VYVQSICHLFVGIVKYSVVWSLEPVNVVIRWAEVKSISSMDPSVIVAISMISIIDNQAFGGMLYLTSWIGYVLFFQSNLSPIMCMLTALPYQCFRLVQSPRGSCRLFHPCCIRHLCPIALNSDPRKDKSKKDSAIRPRLTPSIVLRIQFFFEGC